MRRILLTLLLGGGMLSILLIFGLVVPVAALASEPESTASSKAACIAGVVGKLRGLPNGVPNCGPNEPSCRQACEAGDGPSCLARAYALESEPSTRSEAASLYRRSCLLGVANACTNYAATIWSSEHSEEELECARRIFSKACDAHDPFACGMAGRIAFDQASSPTDFEAARQALEAACKDLKGFPCRVLAKHLEAGDLGAWEVIADVANNNHASKALPVIDG
jgi:hypothetical protein